MQSNITTTIEGICYFYPFKDGDETNPKFLANQALTPEEDKESVVDGRASPSKNVAKLPALISNKDVRFVLLVHSDNLICFLVAGSCLLWILQWTNASSP